MIPDWAAPRQFTIHAAIGEWFVTLDAPRVAALERVISPFSALAHDLRAEERRWIIPLARWPALQQELQRKFMAVASRVDRVG